MIHLALDLALALALVLGLAILGTSRIVSAIRFFSYQAAAVSLVPLLVQSEISSVSAHGLVLFGMTVGLKVYGVPYLLSRSIREADVTSEVRPLIGYGASLGIGGVLIALAFGFARQLPLPHAPASDLLIPSAFGMLLIGLLLLVSRSKAVTQVLGYLVMENGIFVFGILLVDAMPYLVELGVLLDLFVAVFVMGIVIFRINREFDHIDSHQLATLKDKFVRNDS